MLPKLHLSSVEFLAPKRFANWIILSLAEHNVNKSKTTPTPNKNGSYGIKRGGGVRMPYFGSVCHIFCGNLLILTDLMPCGPHCMAYFGGIFFCKYGGWGGQNYFRNGKKSAVLFKTTTRMKKGVRMNVGTTQTVFGRLRIIRLYHGSLLVSNVHTVTGNHCRSRWGGGSL